MRPQVFVNMIVRDEAAVIERCLAAIKPHVAGFIIADTGSTDDTKELIRKQLNGNIDDSSVVLVDQEWVDFGHNRTEALRVARDAVSDVDNAYILVLDADDVFSAPEGFAWPDDEADVYSFLHRMGSNSWWRPQLFRAALPWRYEGVVHEYATCGGQAHKTGKVEGCHIQIGQDGARRSTMSAREKYLGDAKLLEAALAANPNDARSAFYLAQSYRDGGEILKAIDAYRRRIDLGGFEEEIWYSMYQIGRLQQRRGRWDLARDQLLAAYRRQPSRSEPLIALAAEHRRRDEWVDAHLYASAAVTLNRPHDLLFVEDDGYTWRPLDELSIACFYLGRKEQCLAFTEALLARSDLPARERGRIEKNRELCLPFDFTPWETSMLEHLKPLCKTLQSKHRKLHERYTASVSPSAMALSLETAAFAMAVYDYAFGPKGWERVYLTEENKAILDTGSGFSTAALRTEGLPNVSTDDHPHWLTRTEEFLTEEELPVDDLYLWPRANEEATDVPSGPFAMVIHDLGNMDKRWLTLEQVWERVAPGGYLVLDDMHMGPYKGKVTAFLKDKDAEVFDAKPLTTDDFGRYCWLVRRRP